MQLSVWEQAAQILHGLPQIVGMQARKERWSGDFRPRAASAVENSHVSGALQMVHDRADILLVRAARKPMQHQHYGKHVFPPLLVHLAYFLLRVVSGSGMQFRIVFGLCGQGALGKDFGIFRVHVVVERKLAGQICRLNNPAAVVHSVYFGKVGLAKIHVLEDIVEQQRMQAEAVFIPEFRRRGDKASKGNLRARPRLFQL
ncbi:hypothetical protein OGATHE_004238 [Ogataea polymorpha]|uniref:Uncharacterized protein n=1 Tax=Ogataea polymorpha TaxID=460523 RepID=A0A9P8NYR0_9ASCO|nr:hypothetical protein OGATHE_004238 [Ogataea polymorpha]